MTRATPQQFSRSRHVWEVTAARMTIVTAALTVALALYLLIGQVWAMSTYVGWEVSDRLRLLSGITLVTLATIAGIRIASSAWSRTAPPTRSVLGALVSFLIAQLGSLLVLNSMAFFPGPLPGGPG